MYSTVRTPRRATSKCNGSPYGARLLAAGVVISIGLGGVFAGPAMADPEQGGVTTDEPGAEQGGVTGVPTPESAPEIAPAPAPEYPQGILPSPPQEAPPVAWSEPQPYPQAAPEPAPQLHAPRLTAPVAPKLVDIDHIRAGDVVIDRGPVPVDVAVSVNEYLAWSEAKIAQFYRSIGYSPAQADKKAATAVVFGVAGGAAGAMAFGLPAFLATALFTVPIGAVAGGVIGSFVPPNGLNIVPGVAIGAGVGLAVAAGVGAIAGLGGATLGAAIGVGLGYALGGGDADDNPAAPWDNLIAQWQDFVNPDKDLAPLPNPGANQYELVLDAGSASAAGLPAVNYTVNTVGDVDISANVAGQNLTVGWTAEQAQAPFEVLGQLKEPAKELAAAVTKQVGDGLTQIVDGVHITYPQTLPAA